MSRTALPPRPSFEFPNGFPTAPATRPMLWEFGRWQPRSWHWLVAHIAGIERVEVFMADDPNGATFLARIAGGRLFVIVYADRDVLAETLRRMRSLRDADGLADVLRLLDGADV